MSSASSTTTNSPSLQPSFFEEELNFNDEILSEGSSNDVLFTVPIADAGSATPLFAETNLDEESQSSIDVSGQDVGSLAKKKRGLAWAILAGHAQAISKPYGD